MLVLRLDIVPNRIDPGTLRVKNILDNIFKETKVLDFKLNNKVLNIKVPSLNFELLVGQLNIVNFQIRHIIKNLLISINLI